MSDDESQMTDFSSMEIRNERFNNSLFNNNDTNSVKGHHRVFRKINNKTVPIYLYTTRYTPNSKIRNAVSGFGDKQVVVGRAKYEDSFFKVVLATGELGKDPYGNHLYYDSPEQYEKHFYTTVDKKIKDNWWQRYRFNQKIIDKELYDDIQPEFTIIH